MIPWPSGVGAMTTPSARTMTTVNFSSSGSGHAYADATG